MASCRVSPVDLTGKARDMTGKERITRILKRQRTDRIGLYEHFWYQTSKKWIAEGHIPSGSDPYRHFNVDIAECSPNKMVADLDFEPLTLAETEETVTRKDGNGAILRRHKLHAATPEHIGFTVVDRESWDALKPLLTPDPRRINFTAYREAKRMAHERGQFFVWSGINVFECMHPVCGHENMLVGMALDPDWVADMAQTYAQLQVALQKILFQQEGMPDGIWYYEDMGFKERPFMSPAMYRDLIQPSHMYTIDYAKSLGLPVIMHSCGYVEPLLPGMIEAGIDCLQVIEVKAGMDLVKLYRKFGEQISFMGGIDVRVLYSNDRDEIDRELTAKIPIVKDGHGFILHSDHSIPDNVTYESYRYFVERGLELGCFTE